MQPTINEIITVVKLQLGLKEVQAEQHLMQELGAESADVVNIVATIEEKYDIFISEESLIDICSITDLYNLTKSLL